MKSIALPTPHRGSSVHREGRNPRLHNVEFGDHQNSVEMRDKDVEMRESREKMIEMIEMREDDRDDRDEKRRRSR